MSTAQQNHLVFLVTLLKLVWLMKSSCRGEEAHYPNNSIITFGMILKTHRKEKKNQQCKRLEGLGSAAQGKHTKHWAWMLLLSWYLWPASILFHTLENTLNTHAQKGTWELGCQCHQLRINYLKNHMQFHKTRVVGQSYILTVFRRSRLTKAAPKSVW